MYKRSRYKYNIMTTTSWPSQRHRGCFGARGQHGRCRRLQSVWYVGVVVAVALLLLRLGTVPTWLSWRGGPVHAWSSSGGGAVRVVVNARLLSSGPAGARGACDCRLVGVLCVRGRRRAGGL